MVVACSIHSQWVAPSPDICHICSMVTVGCYLVVHHMVVHITSANELVLILHDYRIPGKLILGMVQQWALMQIPMELSSILDVKYTVTTCNCCKRVLCWLLTVSRWETILSYVCYNIVLPKKKELNKSTSFLHRFLFVLQEHLSPQCNPAALHGQLFFCDMCSYTCNELENHLPL